MKNMKSKFYLVLCFVFISSILLDLVAQSMRPKSEEGFIQRAKAVVEHFDVSSSYLGKCSLKQAGYVIGAMVAKQCSKTEINNFAIRLIKHGNEQQLINRGFDYAPLMDSYIRWNSYFTDETKNKFQQFFTTQSSYKTRGTYNEMLMLATARFLVGQTWGEANLPDSIAFKIDDRNAKKFLVKAMRELVYKGMGEYGSNPYAPYSMVCFLSLADLSTDLEIQNMARITYELVLAQSIAPSFKGNYMAVTGRSYPDVWLGDTKGTAIESFLWSYLGLGGMPKSASYVILPCVSSYRLPENLYQLAVHRDEKEVVKTNFQNRFQYSFLNKNYGIYSQRELKSIDGQFQHSGVLWMNSDETKNNLLWVTNPMWDSLAMVKLRHTHGMSKFERVAQFNGTTVHSYNIPDQAAQSDGKVQVQINKYALGFVPGSYLAMINESISKGRIFLHYGKVLIAITASNKFNWNPSETPVSYNNIADLKAGNSQFHVEGLQFGLAIETADPAEYPGSAQKQLEAFKKDVLKHSISFDEKSLTTSYTDRSGAVISCAFNGGDKINNILIAYDDSWGFLNCNGIFQENNKNLTISYQGKLTVYDLQNWKIIK